MNNLFTYRLAAELLASLEAEGYPLGTDKHLQVQELLHRLPEETDAETLRLVICPVLARNAQEQAQVYDLFDECRKRVEVMMQEVSAAEAAGTVPAASVAEKAVKRRRWSIIFTATQLILAIVIGIYYYFGGVPKPVETVQDVIENLPKKDSDSLDQNLQPETQKPQTLFQPKPYPYDHNLAKYAVTPPPAWQEWLFTHWWWLRWALLLPFTLLLFAIWRYLEHKRRKLIAERGHKDQPPYFWNIRIENGAEIPAGDAFGYALQAMRRRSGADTYALDLPRTIHATAERGGLPDFRFREQTRPVEYLLLIDRQHVQNHRARLFDALYQTFREQEIEMARYFYDSDMRVCFNEEYPQGAGLQELQQRYSQARLLVIGTGAQLLSPLTGKFLPWAGLFSAWKQRALFTPRPLADWGRLERRLPEIFTVLPATLQGLGFWIASLEDGQDARFEEWRARVKDAPQLPIQPDERAPLSLLRLHYDEPALQWIAACAIYPSLHWDLTIWLGRRIPQPSENLVSVENLLHLSRLPWFVEGEIPAPARAALLDWLEREYPALLLHLRAELASLLHHNPPPQDSAAFDDYQMNIAVNEWFSTADKHRKEELEKAIARMLASGAEADFTVLKYLDRPRTALDFVVPDAWKKYVYPSGYRGLGWQGKWKDLRWVLPLWLLGAVGLLWPWEMKLYECEGEKVQYMIENETLNLCLDLPEKKVVYLEWLVRDAILKGNINLADSLLTERSNPVIRRQTQSGMQDTVGAETGPPPDLDPNNPPPPPPSGPSSFSPITLSENVDSLTKRVYAEGDKNIAAALFNRGVMLYTGGNKDSTCFYFYSAWNFDSVDSGIRQAFNRCSQDSSLLLEPVTVKSGLEMVAVQGGTYMMGSANGQGDECLHEVKVGNFQIGKYEITEADWAKIMGRAPDFNNNCPDCPAGNISWNDAQAFLQKLNTQTGKQFRLPTEEEWEFAARGGLKSKGYTYSGSNDPASVGWYNKLTNSAKPAGEKQPNELGIFDMSGNLWEWCQNLSQPYPGCKVDKCDGCRVLRGGSWYFGASNTTVSNRDRYYPGSRSIDYGFRVAEGELRYSQSLGSQTPGPVVDTHKIKPASRTLPPEPVNSTTGDSTSSILSQLFFGDPSVMEYVDLVGTWVTDIDLKSGWKIVFRSDNTCQTGFMEGKWHMKSSTCQFSKNKIVIEESGLARGGKLTGMVEWIDINHIKITANWGPDDDLFTESFVRVR